MKTETKEEGNRKNEITERRKKKNGKDKRKTGVKYRTEREKSEKKNIKERRNEVEQKQKR